MNNPEASSPLIKDFNQGDIHFSVSSGCPLDTKAQGEEYASYTVVGEKQGTELTLYTLDICTGSDFVTSETYFDDGTLLSTAIIFRGKVVSYEVAPDLLDSYYGDSAETKSFKGWWSNYKRCVMESATQMSENLLDNPIDRATCEWMPCETIILAICAFDCLVN